MLGLILSLVVFALFIVFVDADFYTFIAALLPNTRAKMKSRYVGKVVWVIGASAGIGEEIAVQMASLGAVLVLSARREDQLKRVAQRCQTLNPESKSPMVLPFDVKDTAKHSEVFQRVLNEHKCVDVVVMNSGVSQRSLAIETKYEVTLDVTAVNTFSFVSLSKCVLPHFLSRREGQFIVTSSVAGKVSTALSSSYNLSKFGLTGFFDGLRCEVDSEGVSVVICCPGPVGTDIVSNAYGSNGAPLGVSGEEKGKKMSVERCAFLMLVAGTYNIYESWQSENPVLLAAYLNQYFPTFTRFAMAKVIGPGRIRSQKEGGDTYSLKEILFGPSKKKKEE